MFLPSVLAHTIPVEPHEQGHAGLVVVALGLGVCIMALLGVRLGEWGLSRAAGWSRAFGLGAMLFLFFDVLKESAGLGQGLVGNPGLMGALVASFGVGMLALPALARADPKASVVAWVWTLSIALHTAGEGWLVGTEAGHVSLAADAGLASFLLHKAIEGATVPLVAASVMGRSGVWMAGAVAASAVAGALGGFLWGGGRTALLLFAAGAGAATFGIFRLGAGGGADLPRAAAAFAGILTVFAAGVLHEI